FNFVAVNPVSPIDPTGYGFTGIIPQVSSGASLPVMALSGLFTLGFSANGPQPRIQNTYQVTDNFSKVWGRHSFKAGFNMDRLSINNPFFNNLSGNFSYNGSGVYSTGNTGADFLLGFPDSYVQGSGSTVRARGREYYSYVQDQWQARHNLTLTYGVAWDIETPWRNLFANGEIMSAFRPGQQSTIFPSMPTGFVFPGDTGINKYGGMSIHYKNFAPRLGFAWSPRDKWSIRGGIGLYYNRTEEELALQTLTNAPFALTSTGATALCNAPSFANPFVGATGTCSAPQTFPYTPPAPGSTFDITPFEPIGLGTVVEDPRFTSPRTANYNLTVERQLSGSTLLSVGYVGNVGRHEEGALLINSAGQVPGVNPAAAAFGCPNGFAMTSSACPQTGSPGGTPYPLAVYGQPGLELTEFNSNYNSLQVQLNRRFSHGLQVLAGYTWSRYFDYTSSLENSAFNFPGINPFDIKSMYGPSANDAPQRFVVSYTYTLPFYSLGHHWKRLTDGWNLAGSYTLQYGLPIPVFNLLSTSLDCDLAVSFFACPDRANRTSTPLGIGNPRNYSIAGENNYWFNPKAFTIPDPGTGMGTANRNPLYGPGLNYGDMALEKMIPITESVNVQLRLETFNTFNHTNFANPATPGFSAEDASPIDSSSFGRIFKVQQISTNGSGRVIQLGAKFIF
ncbi:MAG TPA: TonB-dependent receptor, partial [Terriglobales bacterium]|nr:TonB-dependent receptor [Terriglobales bacterium]